jgi:hypothetical protein
MCWKSEVSQKPQKTSESPYLVLLTKFVSLSVVVMPSLLTTYGLNNFLGTLILAATLHLFCAWMVDQSYNFFTVREGLKIDNMADLTFLCFNDGIVAFRHGMRVLSGLCLIISLNTFLGNEAESLVTLVSDKTNEKY